jgi:hypothetical protein
VVGMSLGMLSVSVLTTYPSSSHHRNYHTKPPTQLQTPNHLISTSYPTQQKTTASNLTPPSQLNNHHHHHHEHRIPPPHPTPLLRLQHPLVHLLNRPNALPPPLLHRRRQNPQDAQRLHQENLGRCKAPRRGAPSQRERRLCGELWRGHDEGGWECECEWDGYAFVKGMMERLERDEGKEGHGITKRGYEMERMGGR